MFQIFAVLKHSKEKEQKKGRIPHNCGVLPFFCFKECPIYYVELILDFMNVMPSLLEHY